MITIAGVYLPDTMGNRMLAVLYLAPHHPLIGRFAPRLAVELRFHVHWEGRMATYKPSGRYESVRNASLAL
jgi:hypothetical protein